MAFLPHKCPHPDCLTENISLQVLAVTILSPESFIAHLECPGCRLPSAARLKRNNPHSGLNPDQVTGYPTSVLTWYQVTEFWPQVPLPQVPELMPPDVSRSYLQAERNFAIKGNEEAAGIMYRKALDVGLKKIDPGLTGMLGPKIKALAKAGKLTEDIATWSDQVRDLGNDAAHEEDPILRDDLIALRNFTEMVLRYLFSLPNAVKKRRGEKLPWEEAPQS